MSQETEADRAMIASDSESVGGDTSAAFYRAFDNADESEGESEDGSADDPSEADASPAVESEKEEEPMALRRAGRGTRAAVLKTPQSTPQSTRVFPSSLVLSSRVSSKKNTPGRRVTFTPSALPAEEYNGAGVRASARRIRRSDSHLYGTSVEIRSRSTVPSTVGSTAYT